MLTRFARMSEGGLWNDYGACDLQYHDALFLVCQQYRILSSRSLYRRTSKKGIQKVAPHILSIGISLCPSSFSALPFGLNYVIMSLCHSFEHQNLVSAHKCRRRALMRSCAAMLSVQREFRRHCPAEDRRHGRLTAQHALSISMGMYMYVYCIYVYVYIIIYSIYIYIYGLYSNFLK